MELATYVHPETGARLPVALKFCETSAAAVNTARIVGLLDPAFVADLVSVELPAAVPTSAESSRQSQSVAPEGVSFLDDGKAPRHTGFPYVLVMLAGDNTLLEILDQHRKVGCLSDVVAINGPS